MTPALSELHAEAIAAVKEVASAAASNSHWEEERAMDRAKQAIDALAVYAECLEVKVGP